MQGMRVAFRRSANLVETENAHASYSERVPPRHATPAIRTNPSVLSALSSPIASNVDFISFTQEQTVAGVRARARSLTRDSESTLTGIAAFSSGDILIPFVVVVQLLSM
ncbi:unnamed protein product [Peniophora sp. CBMAI 1063]|nr:unnamed protein product [Peniophora sp. CBMAI 1063]